MAAHGGRDLHPSMRRAFTLRFVARQQRLARLGQHRPPSALSPNARASCKAPTRVLVTAVAAGRASAGRKRRTRFISPRTRPAPDSRSCGDWRGISDTSDDTGQPPRSRPDALPTDRSRPARAAGWRLLAPLFHPLHQARGAILPGALDRLDQHRVARRKVRVEATVGQPRFLHDVSHAHAGVALAAHGARGDLDDALVGLLFAGSGTGHGGDSKYDDHHINEPRHRRASIFIRAVLRKAEWACAI